MTASSDDYATIDALVDELLELAPEHRAVRLDELASEHPTLIDRLRELIAADARLEGTSFMAEPALEQVTIEETVDQTGADAAEPVPSAIGRYRVVRQLGAGGMGTVYLAEQTEPVERQVALKVTHAFQSERDRARFALEAQALARMQHPNVATMYDNGTTPDGTPFVVMELVEQAQTILAWCDRTTAGVEQRLGLFQQVCAGVAHAHEKGLLHRDLKPANVLVTLVDGQPVVKVIDFGIARAFSAGGERGAVSQASVAGSPVYMSPEAIGATGKRDLDTRSDVYSLGLLLCQLIAGDLPFPPDESLHTLVERLRSDRTIGPANWLARQSAAHVQAIAAARGISAASLQRAVEGDLDAIVLKAISYERGERYPSPRELAKDLDRHLRHEPIEARPPAWAYFARRFVRRNLGTVAVVSLAFIALVGFAVTMTVQAGRIATERDRANREAQAKGFVAEFLSELFAGADPYESTGGGPITLRQVLDRGAANIDGALEDQPEVRAELLATMGEAYRALGVYPEAGKLIEQALTARRALYGDVHVETLEVVNVLAALYVDQGRYQDAQGLMREIMETRAQLLGPQHLQTLRATGNLAVIYHQLGRLEEAEGLYQRNLAIYQRQLGEDAPETLADMDRLSRLYRSQGRLEEAGALSAEVLGRLRRVRGDNDLRTFDAHGLAYNYALQGRLVDSERYYLEAYEGTRRILGDEHPSTLESLQSVAEVRVELGRYADAEPMLTATLEARRRVLGGEHPNTITTQGWLSRLYRLQGRLDEALAGYDRVVRSQETALGADHPKTLASLVGLGQVYLAQKRFGAARSLFRQVSTTLLDALGEEHPTTLRARHGLANAYAGLGRLYDADLLYEEAVLRSRRVNGARHPDTAKMLFDHALTRVAMGQEESAKTLLGQAVEAGFADERRLRNDPGLESLHSGDFDRLVAIARDNAAARGGGLAQP
ncbi:MAG: serine/threonine-protein kinase [Pseudomonadota bacterium]